MFEKVARSDFLSRLNHVDINSLLPGNNKVENSTNDITGTQSLAAIFFSLSHTLNTLEAWTKSHLQRRLHILPLSSQTDGGQSAVKKCKMKKMEGGA